MTPAPGQTLVTLSDLVYLGHRAANGSPLFLSIHTLDGRQLGLLLHRPKHSPTGINWGYNGSGAADCARSLLAAAVGDTIAVCLICKGTAKIIYPGGGDPREARTGETGSDCGFCDHGLKIMPAVYQAFKEHFVARWDDTFAITRSEIITWLTQEYPQENWPHIR